MSERDVTRSEEAQTHVKLAPAPPQKPCKPEHIRTRSTSKPKIEVQLDSSQAQSKHRAMARSLSANASTSGETGKRDSLDSGSLPSLVEEEVTSPRRSEEGSSSPTVPSAKHRRKHRKDEKVHHHHPDRESLNEEIVAISRANSFLRRSSASNLNSEDSSEFSKRKTKLLKGGLRNTKKLFGSEKKKAGDDNSFVVEVPLNPDEQLSQAREQRKSMAVPKIRPPKRIVSSASSSSNDPLDPEIFLMVNEKDWANLPKHGPLDQQADTKRTYIIKELLSTEQSYIQSLTDGVAKYHKMKEAVATNSEIPGEMLDIIFSKLEPVQVLNKEKILQELYWIESTWDSRSSEIGDLFVRHFPALLKTYVEYTNGYGRVMNALDRIATQPWFSTFCEAKVQLESILICPIQRMPRYKLLLEDLWKNTPEEHVDFKKLRKAVILAGKVADYINLAMTKHTNEVKLASFGLSHLSQGRKLIHEARMAMTIEHHYPITEKHRINVHVLLFDDILVYFVENKKAIIKRAKAEIALQEVVAERIDCNIIPLELCWLLEVGDTSQDKFIFHRITVYGPGATLILETGSSHDWELWWQHLQATIRTRLDATQEEKDLPVSGTLTNKTEQPMRRAKHTWSPQKVYEGYWAVGWMHGEGVLEQYGQIYDGIFEENIKSGKGVLQYNDGSIYTGDFQNNAPEGDGMLRTQNGDLYTLKWKAGKMHGEGSVLYSNSDYFQGTWVDGAIIKGTLVRANGDEYIGGFERGLYNGEGKLCTTQGFYTGNFADGVKHGRGKWESRTDASFYEGDWLHGKQHGEGVLQDTWGHYTGDFYKGVRKGNGKQIFKDQSHYTGTWLNNKPHGTGVFNSPSLGILYEGEWTRGKIHGKGKIQFYKTGTTYEGSLLDGQPNGAGIASCSHNGYQFILDTRWLNGARVEGKGTVTIIDPVSKATTTFQIGDPMASDYILPKLWVFPGELLPSY
eukprot:TRINITY_DN5448_c1_g1_i1.p1 TRINITY_DN5448_c1_g1~~TRINITY_DN5448_c1_g1_i1.p1  ORF type:complete len:964 (+),score=165.14 TRINITY_DN5448_c1_g1_i1:42-2933(+)